MRYPDCWYDDSADFNAHGYAYIFFNGNKGKKGPVRAHRFVYEQFYGAIPKGLVLDHLCRNRGCVNPYHMLVCTQRDNLLANGSKSVAAVHAARTECPKGHQYNRTNTAIRTHNGSRRCKACHRDEEAARRYRNSARAATPMRDAAYPSGIEKL